jgi:putative ABC transport system permease protein
MIAYRNTLENPRRLTATSIGIAFAVFLTISQVGLLIGFVAAAEHVVRAAAADIWIVPPGVTALENPSRIDRRVGDRIAGQIGVGAVESLSVGFADWRGPSIRSSVALIGAQPGGRSGLPVPPTSATSSWASAIAVNERNGRSLGISSVGDGAEIGGRTVEVTRLLTDFASFLATPYAFVENRAAQTMLGLPEEQASYLLVFTDASDKRRELAEVIRRTLPQYDVYLTEEFARKSSGFWLTQTGAGGGFLLTAALGFIVGVVIVSQTLYTSVINRQREYAALAAIGANSWDLRRIVISEAMLSGVIGGLLGIAFSYPGVWLMREKLVPWIEIPAWLRISALMVALSMSALAAIAALRVVVRQDPASVLRG